MLPTSRPEFIAIIAAVFALAALGIDAMLPGLPLIASDLSPGNVNAAQLVITAFVLGMSVGTAIGGPASDQTGRKPTMIAGTLIYLAAAGLGWLAPSLDLLVIARVFQGMGGAMTSVACMALIRDRFAGAEMAKVISFGMMIFAAVPALAPLLGQTIIARSNWHMILFAFVAFGFLLTLWIAFRIGETLPPEKRRAFSPASFAAAARQVLATAIVRRATIGVILTNAILFTILASIQPIFDRSFGMAQSFPLWFAGVACSVFLASLGNGLVIARIGIRRLLKIVFACGAAFNILVALAFLTGTVTGHAAFALFYLWVIAQFVICSTSQGNLIAMGMEPMGHLAGIASSIISATGYLLGTCIAIPLGMAFDGTPRPIMLGFAVLATLAFIVVATVPTDEPV